MKLDLEAIRARCEALDGRVDKIVQMLEGIVTERDMAWTEVERLRASLEAVLEEATSDLDRDIIITECQSALLAAWTVEA